MSTPTPTKQSAVFTTPADNQILITRTFAAPPTAVYQVFTEPDLISRWWAGRRGQMIDCQVDLRVGGTWRFALDAGGFEVAFRGTYREVTPDQRFVTTEIYQTGPGASDEEPGAICTYAFNPDSHGGTTFTLLTEFADRITRDAVLASGMEAGAQEGYDIADRLALELIGPRP